MTRGSSVPKTKASALFAELLAEKFPTAEERASHEREVAKLVAFAELLIALDEVRVGSKMFEAELARRSGVKPLVISRLLEDEGRKVQLDAVADVAADPLIRYLKDEGQVDGVTATTVQTLDQDLYG